MGRCAGGWAKGDPGHRRARRRDRLDDDGRLGVRRACRASPRPSPRLLGQGVAPTSVLARRRRHRPGRGARRARGGARRLELDPRVTLATSSAAGGLRMTVHGLTQKMTAMAAREAALGAGGVVEYQTAGRLRDADLRRIDEVRPEPHPARRRRRGRRLRHGALQRRAARANSRRGRSSSTAATRVVCAEARELLEARASACA